MCRTFTPGPWKVASAGADDDFTKPVCVFEVLEGGGESPHKLRIADVYAWGSTHERDATAQLIAEAPDLLAACEYVAQFKGAMSAEQVEVLAKRCRLAANKARGN